MLWPAIGLALVVECPPPMQNHGYAAAMDIFVVLFMLFCQNPSHFLLIVTRLAIKCKTTTRVVLSPCRTVLSLEGRPRKGSMPPGSYVRMHPSHPVHGPALVMTPCI